MSGVYWFITGRPSCTICSDPIDNDVVLDTNGNNYHPKCIGLEV